jgi:hypothetical protein
VARVGESCKRQVGHRLAGSQASGLPRESFWRQDYILRGEVAIVYLGIKS